jgi:hypothetical protein
MAYNHSPFFYLYLLNMLTIPLLRVIYMYVRQCIHVPHESYHIRKLFVHDPPFVYIEHQVHGPWKNFCKK